MTATYTGGNIDTSNKDLVRFLVGDTNTASAKLTDEEIDALLVIHTNPYCAAAAALSHLMTKYASSAQGLRRKEVDDLTVEWHDGQTFEEAFRKRINELKVECIKQTATDTNPYLFKAL